MGVSIVLRTSENEPHTSSHNFSSFPNGFPGHIISVLLTAPSQYHYPSISSIISLPICILFSIHLPNTKTHRWGPHPPPALFHKLTPSHAKPSFTRAPISVSAYSTQIILYLFGNCKNPFVSTIYLYFCHCP
jgi:hypothetical protein